MRLTSEELNEVRKKYGVDILYSWSRLETFRNSPYEYFLQYIQHKKPDREDSIYGSLGGQVHNILERYYENKITYKNMTEEWEDSWLTCYELAGLKFDRSDVDRNKSISEKYYQDISHFFKNHKRIATKVELERFLSVKINNYVLQGYADLITKNNDGKYVIVDWKTSSYFNSKAAEEKCGQLVVYAQALMQAGIKIEDILICWNMLKYCNVEVSMKNGNKKVRTIERYKLGESLVSNCRMWLKDHGCNEEETDNYLKELIDTNDIIGLPIEVQNKFSIEDCYVFVPLTQKLIDRWNNEITTTIKDIELRKADWETTHNEKIWWDTDKSVEAQSYYMANLMAYSPNLHKPYADFLSKLKQSTNDNDIFGNLFGGDGKHITSNDIKIDSSLTWLNDI